MSENQREDRPGTLPSPDCGDATDGDRLYLWLKVKNWSKQPLVPCNPVMRLYENPECAVMSGGPGKGLLLVPTARVKGIECHDVWSNPALHYWNTAWGYVDLKMNTTRTGLGINSALKRSEDQLHIHMADFNPPVQAYLDANVGKLATSPDDWAKKVLIVPGHDSTEDRTYRGLYAKEPTLEKVNLFYLVAKYTAFASSDRMANQTIIVVPAGKYPGFYILNSEPTLSPSPGTGTCDFILNCT
ncbi:CDP-diacylglycerol diphosphatase [Streptomyces katrae]|uniref:CDP-diacylglycerol diphosphatase n=1 Tax=Streptomyces katrae TaxID=68223 RepID=UPI0004C1FFF3|nr:CDP-diacylglycerol diphosphatase [Streptomyces katrae]